MKNTYKATKNNETLKYITADGAASCDTMLAIKSACALLSRDISAISVTTEQGWTVERMK